MRISPRREVVTMQIGVPRETVPLERRVALTPSGAQRLVQAGHPVAVESGAGEGAHFPDAAYAQAGATVVGDAYEGSGVVVKVRAPSEEEAERPEPGAVLASLFQPERSPGVAGRLAERGVTVLALERVPRITRAQGMDVLSSQATVAGYEAVLLGAGLLGRFLPMLTTAAGTYPPARCFVIGAGVAGLQAIATARRLGGSVSAFDVRAAAREQVESLGATFVAAEAMAGDAETRGGYAREQTEDERARTQEALARHLAQQDLVVTTALVPGRPAPRLLTAAMIAAMRPGSVIVDMAAEAGGNCEPTRPGETVTTPGGVIVAGPLDLASRLPVHASEMFSRNVTALLGHLLRDGVPNLGAEDEIVGPMRVEEEVLSAT
jgi:NAD(P) transhydrogenase subunit alpha